MAFLFVRRTAGRMGICIVIGIIGHPCEGIEGTSDDSSNIKLESLNAYKNFARDI